LGSKKPTKEDQVDSYKKETKEINFNEENEAELSDQYIKSDQIETDSISHQTFNTIEHTENEFVPKVESVTKSVALELNIDPSKTLSLKTRTSAKKPDNEDGLSKQKKVVKEKKTKKDTVMVNDLIINKDLINSNRF